MGAERPRPAKAEPRSLRVELRVHPGAARERLHWDGSVLHLWVTAPAVEGRANTATLRAVARWTRRPPSAVRLVAGARGRTKIVEVDGITTLPGGSPPEPHPG